MTLVEIFDRENRGSTTKKLGIFFNFKHFQQKYSLGHFCKVSIFETSFFVLVLPFVKIVLAVMGQFLVVFSKVHFMSSKRTKWNTLCMKRGTRDTGEEEYESFSCIENEIIGKLLEIGTLLPLSQEVLWILNTCKRTRNASVRKLNGDSQRNVQKEKRTS